MESAVWVAGSGEDMYDYLRLQTIEFDCTAANHRATARRSPSPASCEGNSSHGSPPSQNALFDSGNTGDIEDHCSEPEMRLQSETSPEPKILLQLKTRPISYWQLEIKIEGICSRCSVGLLSESCPW